MKQERWSESSISRDEREREKERERAGESQLSKLRPQSNTTGD